MNDKRILQSPSIKSSTNKDSYPWSREQLIDSNGGAKFKEEHQATQLMGISPNNKKKNRYMKSATDEFGELI